MNFKSNVFSRKLKKSFYSASVSTRVLIIKCAIVVLQFDNCMFVLGTTVFAQI